MYQHAQTGSKTATKSQLKGSSEALALFFSKAAKCSSPTDSNSNTGARQRRRGARPPLLKKSGEVIESDHAILIEIGGTGVRTITDARLTQQSMKHDHVTFIDDVITIQISPIAWRAQIAKGHDIGGAGRNQAMTVEILGAGGGIVSVGKRRTGPPLPTLAPGEETPIRGTRD